MFQFMVNFGALLNLNAVSLWILWESGRTILYWAALNLEFALNRIVKLPVMQQLVTFRFRPDY